MKATAGPSSSLLLLLLNRDGPGGWGRGRRRRGRRGGLHVHRFGAGHPGDGRAEAGQAGGEEDGAAGGAAEGDKVHQGRDQDHVPGVQAGKKEEQLLYKLNQYNTVVPSYVPTSYVRGCKVLF